MVVLEVVGAGLLVLSEAEGCAGPCLQVHVDIQWVATGGRPLRKTFAEVVVGFNIVNVGGHGSPPLQCTRSLVLETEKNIGAKHGGII